MELPLFPLHLVLFPGRPQPLHIFEQRYRELLVDCEQSDRRFGIVAIRCGAEAGGQARPYDVGTIAEISDVEHLPDGRANLVSRGVDRFRITELLHDRPYLRARVEQLDDQPSGPQDEQIAGAVRAALIPYLAELGAPEELLARIPTKPAPLSWLAAAAVQVDVPEQQQLLEVDSCGRRLEQSLRILRREHGFMRHVGSVGSLRPVAPAGAQLN